MVWSQNIGIQNRNPNSTRGSEASEVEVARILEPQNNLTSLSLIQQLTVGKCILSAH